MDAIADILSRIAEISVTVGSVAKALIGVLSGIFISKKLPKSPDA